MPAIGVLVMAYGGPNSLDEVEPYLMDVRGGRPTAAEIVEEVRQRYAQIGGRSPILERTKAQAAALEAALNGSPAAVRRPFDSPFDSAQGRALGRLGVSRLALRRLEAEAAFRAFVGMRHWHPYIKDALAQMTGAGMTRAVGLVMAPHYSRMSVGAYYKKVDEAHAPVEIARIERWGTLPGYLDALADRVRTALEGFPASARARVPILFTAHSLPQRILEWNDPYPDELRATVAGVVERLGSHPHEFAYQSAAMTPEPWLGPDVGDVIARLAAEGEKNVLIAPIGFVCDHVEVLYDVDIALRQQAQALGMRLARIEMLNDAPPMIAGLADLARRKAKEAGWL